MNNTQKPEPGAVPFDFQSSLTPEQCAALLRGMQAEGLLDHPKCRVEVSAENGTFLVRRYGKTFQTAEVTGTLESGGGGTASGGTRVRGAARGKPRVRIDDWLSYGALTAVLVLLVGLVPALTNGLLIPLLCLLPLCSLAAVPITRLFAAHNRDRLLSDLRQKLRATG